MPPDAAPNTIAKRVLIMSIDWCNKSLILTKTRLVRSKNLPSPVDPFLSQRCYVQKWTELHTYVQCGHMEYGKLF
jgi:hypothetical protein